MRVVYQNEVAECGYACIAMVLGRFGRTTRVSELRQKRPISANGLKMSDLFDIAQDFGLNVMAFNFDASDVPLIKPGSLIHFGGAHFLVFESAHRGYVRVIDPAVGRRRVAMDLFMRNVTGYLLQFEKTPQLQRIRDRMPVWGALRRVMDIEPGLRRQIARIMAAGIAAQAAILALPYLGSLVLDRVVAGDNMSLLNVIAITFGGIFLLGAGSQYVQGVMLELVTRRTGLGASQSLFARLLSNPIGYFEKRNVGDLFTRFKAQADIAEFAVRTPVQMGTDLIIGLAALALMLVQSPMLSALALALFGVYLLVSLVLYPRMLDLHQHEVIQSSQCDDALIETVRGASLLKLAQAEVRRTTLFMGVMQSWAMAAFQSRRLTSARDSVLKLVEYADSLLLTYIAAKLMVTGKVSTGTFYSFLIYKSMMSNRLAKCVNAAVEFFMLRVPVERVEDILETEPERYTPLPQREKTPETAHFERLSLQGACFAYGTSERPVLADVDLDVRRGDKLVIEGPSGSGKSTLLKLLAAVESPTAGRIALNGVSYANLAVDEVRRHMAHMRQGDIILHGSIAENISLFSATPDEELIHDLLRATGLLEDVMQLPMRTQTRISDSIANISAGQRQRLLLARALYSRREVLLLDEPTSNLDPASVDRVGRVLMELPRTLIVITHDSRLASLFQRRHRLTDGTLHAV